MIVVTGAAGFIGSCIVGKLNENGLNDVILVDNFSNPQKNHNIEGKSFSEKVERTQFFEWLDLNHKKLNLLFTSVPGLILPNSEKLFLTS